MNIFLFRPDINLGATIKDLQQKSVLEILAEPNLMAVNGQKATFLAGGEFPFPIVQPSQGFTSITIQFKPFGVRLDFTGTISNDNVIRLHVAPEVSTLDFSNGLTISGFNIPAISTRRAETEVELKDGQSFGIAGLMDHRAQVQLAKVPGIADIPVLGQLFRSRSINRSNTELLVLVTPHIVDPVHAQTAVPVEPKPAIPYIEQSQVRRQTAWSRKEAGRSSITEFEMSGMTAKDPVKAATRENLPPGDPLSVVSICLDKETWGILKLFADSVPLIRLDRHLGEYRVDDHESVLDWIGNPAPDVCLLDFDHDRRSAALVAERIHADAPETSIFAVSSQSQPDLIIQAMRSGCSEYLVKPLDSEQLLNAVARVGGRRREKKDQAKAQVLAFIGAKGGCGVTTIVTQLGALLAKIVFAEAC